MHDALRLGLVQGSGHADVATAREHVAAGVREAATRGAELVLLQELHDGPYFCQTEDPAVFDRAEPIPGPGSDHLGALAAELGVVIVGSLFERRAAGLCHNTAVVLERDGSLVGRYRKMHIPDDPGYHEKFYFTQGDAEGAGHGFTPVDTSVGRLGVLVCWDQWYPEAARLMALAGAEILLYPTAIGWDPADDATEQARQLDAWRTVQRGHAIANSLPVAACNRVGFEATPGGDARDGALFWGNSFACGPQGELLFEAPNDGESVVVIPIERGRTDTVRRMWPFFRDRRVDAYGDLTRRWRDDSTD